MSLSNLPSPLQHLVPEPGILSRWRWVACLTLFLPLSSAGAQEVCFYHDHNFTGTETCWPLTESGVDVAWIGDAINDSFSSVDLPEGYRVELFEDRDYDGRSLDLYRSNADFSDLFTPAPPGGFNDLVSSFRVTALAEGGQDRVCLFEHNHFSGQRACYEVPGLGEALDVELPTALNDAASSLTVPPAARVRVFRDGGFAGSAATLVEDTAQVDHFDDGLPLNDQISSLRIENLLGRPLLINGDGSEPGLTGWQLTTPGCWVNGVDGFNTSYQSNCRRSQEIDLLAVGFAPLVLSRQPMIAVSERVASTYCSDRARIKVELLDASRQVVDVWDTGFQQIPGLCNWEVSDHPTITFSHAFRDYGTEVRYIRWTDEADEFEGWAGVYGPLFNDAMVQVLADDHPAYGVNLISNPSGGGGISGWSLAAGSFLDAFDDGEPYLRLSGDGVGTGSGHGAEADFAVDLWKQSIAGDPIASSLFVFGLEYRVCGGENPGSVEIYLSDAQGAEIGFTQFHLQDSCSDWTTGQVSISGLPPETRGLRFGVRLFTDPIQGLEFRNATATAMGENLLQDPNSTHGAWQTTGIWSEASIDGGRLSTAALGRSLPLADPRADSLATRSQTLNLDTLGIPPQMIDDETVLLIHQEHATIGGSGSVELQVDLLDANEMILATLNSGPMTGGSPQGFSSFDDAFMDFGPEVRYLRWTETAQPGALVAAPFVGFIQPDNHEGLSRNRRAVRETSSCGLPGQAACNHFSLTNTLCNFLSALTFHPRCNEHFFTKKVCYDGARLVGDRCRAAGVYCCDDVKYSDYSDDGGWGYNFVVTKGKVSRVYLGGVESVVPQRDSAQCTGDFLNPSASVVKNTENTHSYNSAWWGDTHHDLNLMVNANFFLVKIGNQSHNPYKYSCTTAFGLAVSDDATVAEAGQVHGENTATLVIFTDGAAKRRGHFAEIVMNPNGFGNDIEDAVSGFRLLDAGRFVTQPARIDPSNPRPRTAIGLTEEKDELIIVVVNPGRDDKGTRLRALAGYLKTLGAHDALTLDGSGSSQLFFRQGSSTIQTLPSDLLNGPPIGIGGGPYYRPVPIFLGFKAKKGRHTDL